MHARIGRWQGDEAELARWAQRSRDEVVPQVQATQALAPLDTSNRTCA
jgi:hypothetical protein